MQVRPDFRQAVAKLAESTPRAAIANLLSAILPRVPVKSRVIKPLPDANDWLKEYPDAVVIRPDDENKMIGAPDDVWKGGGAKRKLAGDKGGPRTRKALPKGVLTSVRPNPKKRESAKRYDGYHVGQTAAWHVANTSMTAADIVWDVEHNFTTWRE